MATKPPDLPVCIPVSPVKLVTRAYVGVTLVYRYHTNGNDTFGILELHGISRLYDSGRI